MNNDINLLVTKDTGVIKEKKRIKIFRIIAVSFLVIIASLSVILFIASAQSSLSSVKKDKELALSTMSSVQKKSAKLSILRERINSSENIIKTRKDFSPIINLLFSEIPEGLSPSTLDFEKETILLTIYGNSLVPMDKFINNLIGVSKKMKIGTISIDSLSLNSASGVYSLTVKIKAI